MPSWLLYTIGVLVFAVGLLLSIALHEIGHMVPAKRFGVKVTQYMVGFGPTLWSRRRGDTEYGIKGIPLGGYIRMIGMVPPRPGSKPSRWPRRLATAVEDFREANRAGVDPQDEHRQFYRLIPGKKMIIMMGGPCMNLLIYVVLTFVILGGIGLPHDKANTTVAAVVPCVVPVTATSDKCPADAPVAPAYGKLKAGDRIEAVNGVTITGWQQLSDLIRANPNTKLDFLVRRGGADVHVSLTPTTNTVYAGDTGTKTIRAGYLGFSPGDHHYYVPVSVTAVPGQIAHQVHQGFDAIGAYPKRVAELWQTVFEGKKRNASSAIGVIGYSRLGGDFASSTLLTDRDKVFELLELLATVNLLLFFVNMIPLVPFDGGHVFGALIEATRRGFYRVRRRISRTPERVGPPRTIFVDTAQMLPVLLIIGPLLIGITLLTFYADIVKPVNLLGG